MAKWLGIGCAVAALLVGCGGGRTEDEPPPPPPDPPASTLKTDAEVAFRAVYDAVGFEPAAGENRAWIPVDVAAGPRGELWVVQQAAREPGFDDVTECTARGAQNFDPDDDDCESLLASTVTIREPALAEPATEDNGRAHLVSDFNSWHFMRRPSAIAFGAAEVVVRPEDGGADEPTGSGSLITEPVTYRDTFATCHDTLTGNFTDEPPFIGPTLWTADPSVYDGTNGSESWSNGAHLDMVHATQYCTGIAWERDNVYWAINGMLGTLDRYDFGAPHLAGHFYHDDAVISRYGWDGSGLARLAGVPSNAVFSAGTLFVADTGNGRVVAVDTTATPEMGGTFLSFEGLEATNMWNLPLTELATEEALGAAWGGVVEPSGLAILDDETLVVASHGTGHVTLLGLDGAIARTIDTGLGAGLGGLTVVDGVIYFAHMTERRIYRIDVLPPAEG